MSQNKLLFLLVTIISLIALASFCLSPFFQIREVNFIGLHLLTTEEMNNLLKPYYLANIIILDKSVIEEKLLQSSYIKGVRVDKKLPDKLEVKITERRPLAKINNNGKYLVFTANGFILENSVRVIESVPEIRGMGYSLKTNNLVFTPVLEKIVQALNETNRDTVSLLSLIQQEEAKKLTAYAGEIPIFLGTSGELQEKFRIIQSVLEKAKGEKLPYEYIDLSITQKPVIKLKTKN